MFNNMAWRLTYRDRESVCFITPDKPGCEHKATDFVTLDDLYEAQKIEPSRYISLRLATHKPKVDNANPQQLSTRNLKLSSV